MKAGFARVKLTPAIGATMTGYIRRDREGGCEGIHDDLHARALYLEDRGEEALIMGFDLCFFSRDETDRFKGAIGRRVDLSPQQILFNTSHTHTGPKVGTWQYDPPPDLLYLQVVEDAIVEAAIRSRDSMVDVSLWAGATRSALPMSRRLRLGDGTVVWRPSPEAEICDTLPVSALKDSAGNTVCVLFSVSCHASTVHGREISADYPGVAMDRLDTHLGRTCSLFLQGAGGDAKPSVIGEGETLWRRGTWEDMDRAGNIVADEVLSVLEAGLSKVEPGLRTRTMEAQWPLEPNIGRAGFAAVLADPESILTRRLWAEEKLAWLDAGHELPTTASVTTHGIRLGDGLRMVGLEGEPVAAFGLQMLDFYDGGVTFPLGYTDGVQMYLVTSKMLDEGGYEAVSSHEYHQPAPLAKGMEAVLDDSLKWLVEQGID